MIYDLRHFQLFSLLLNSLTPLTGKNDFYKGIEMKTTLTLTAAALAALLLTGCSNTQHHEQTTARLSATETATARAQARADEAYRKAEEALAAAQRAQQSADEANERARRMLDQASRK